MRTNMSVDKKTEPTTTLLSMMKGMGTKIRAAKFGKSKKLLTKTQKRENDKKLR